MNIQKFLNEDGLWVRHGRETYFEWSGSYFQMGESDTFFEIDEKDAEALIKELSDWIEGNTCDSKEEESKEASEEV